MFVPRYIFLTKGVGRHKEKLSSFEEALRDAKIAQFNLVHVSSIFPPRCKIISLKKGLEKLKPGQVVFTIKSVNETNENHRLIAASVGLAIPKDPNQFGYLSEHVSFGETDDQAGEYAEELAATMLATISGLDAREDLSWDEKKQIWKLSGNIIRTTNITQSAIGVKGMWTTVVAAAVLVL